MSFINNAKERVSKFLEKLNQDRERANKTLMKDKYLKIKLENLLKTTIEFTAQEAITLHQQRMGLQDIQSKLKESAIGGFGLSIDVPDTKIVAKCDEIVSNYSSCLSENQKLKDLDVKIARLDLGEKIRAFCLRILTAIGIAAIVLLASYLAHKWGIPLPLRMGV